MNIIKTLKQFFCDHEVLQKCNIIHYYKPNIRELRGEYFEYEALKCKNCGKIFD